MNTPNPNLDAPDDDVLLEPFLSIAINFAVEGIPVHAIARGLRQPADRVWTSLREARDLGSIIEVPPADWPPTARRADRQPYQSGAIVAERLMGAVRKTYKLTNLESVVFVALLTHENVRKGEGSASLHQLIQYERRKRHPNGEETNPKMVDVIICKLRDKLKAHKIEIVTLWGSGYYIDSAVRRRVLQELQPGAHKDAGLEAQHASDPAD